MLLDTATVSFADDVPQSIRALFSNTVDRDGQVLVCIEADSEEVLARLRAGENLVELSNVALAEFVMHQALELGEWERSMTHQSLIPYLQEETAEFAEAVEDWTSSGNELNLKKELSDVFLQILFHSELASRRQAFTFDDVAAAFVAKMRSRAPYLFDGTKEIVPTAEQERLWVEGKRREVRGSSNKADDGADE